MGEIYGWIAGGLGVVVALVLTWVNGRSKGKAVAEQKHTEQVVEATKAAAQRETTVSREAAHVDQKVNNATDADVDKQLRDKWTRPGSH
jgi:hypothetical protein